MPAQFAAHARRPLSTTHEAEALLHRYPNIDDKELGRLGKILPALPIVDQAIIIADETLSERVAAYYRDRNKIDDAPSWALFLSLICPTLLASAVFWWVAN